MPGHLRSMWGTNTMPKILKITNRYFLPLSAVFCLILLFLSLFWRNSENQKMMLSQGIVSKVNGELISEDTFQQYLSALEYDKKNQLTKVDREHVLDRMIEEELLLQQGLKTEIYKRDPAIRNKIILSVIESITSQGESEEVSDKKLKEFYQEHRSRFLTQDHYKLLAYKVSANGKSFSTLLKNHGEKKAMKMVSNVEKLSVPLGLLPKSRLGSYLGEKLVLKLSSMENGSISQTLQVGSSHYVINLIDKVEASLRPFNEVKSLVEFAYRKNKKDRTLNRYLKKLKGQGDIQKYVF